MKLKKVYNKYFPFQGYVALMFYPWVFIREDKKQKYTARVSRHETTHALQQVETLWLLFFVIYGLEWIIKLPLCGFDFLKTHYSISYEQEAYNHEEETYYNDVRKHYAWMRYIFTLAN